MSYRQSATSLDLIFTSFNGAVQALERETGHERWQQPGPSFNRPVLCTDGVRLYAFNTGTLSALDAGTGTPLWRVVVPIDIDASEPRLELVRDTILLAHNGILFAYATQDGSLRWKRRAANFTFASDR